MEESDGTFAFQLYGDSGYYGFLDGEWAGWDIQKLVNGAFSVDEGSGLKRVLNQANWSSYITLPTSLPANGGNADTVDSLHAASFARSDASDTLSGDYAFTGGHGAINITSSSIVSNASSTWTGNPGSQGKIQYHSNRWYIVSDSSSNLICQFRRDGADKSYIDNNGTYVGNLSGTASYASNSNLLDGIDAASFLRSDAADSFSSTITMATQKALVANNYGRGVYGTYSASRYQHVWSMGTSYSLADDGTSSGTGGNLYGLAWSYNPNYAYSGSNAQSRSGLNHQLLLMQNGSTTFAAGSGVWTTGTISSNAQGTLWGSSNDGVSSGLVADYAGRVTFNTQGNSNTTLKLLLGDTSNSTVTAGTVYKDNELSYNCSSNTLNTGSINFSNWNYQSHLSHSGSAGPTTHNYVTTHSNSDNAYQSGWTETVASQGASNVRTLGVSNTGELANDIVEQSVTMTRAQFNAMSVGSHYNVFTFSNSRGSNPGRVGIVFEVILCMRYTSYSNAALSSASGKIMRLASNNYTAGKTIAEFRADTVTNMTQSSYNNSLCSFLYQDRESRLYHCENDITLAKLTSATLGSHVTSLTIKVRYKMYDGASF